jgi:regulator of replication initiation timing
LEERYGLESLEKVIQKVEKLSIEYEYQRQSMVSKKQDTTELEGSGLQTRMSILEDENARLQYENQNLKALLSGIEKRLIKLEEDNAHRMA